MQWRQQADGSQVPENGMTLQEQMLRWRFVLDIEGKGYSGRVKMLMHWPRLLLLVDRPWTEYFYPAMKPWVHYVPVKRDLSDLIPVVRFLLDHPGLERAIVSQQNSFASRSLSRAAAVEHWCQLMLRHGVQLRP
jgi:hypothetical protein